MAEDRQRRKWAERQVRALTDAGFDPLDADETVRWVLERMPDGVNMDTWTVPAEVMAAEAEIMPEHVKDARADWYANPAVPPAFKRLLDARLVDAG